MNPRAVRAVVGLLMLAVGIVWLLQGIGSIRGSVMTGSPLWAGLGSGFIVVAGVLLVGVLRRKR